MDLENTFYKLLNHFLFEFGRVYAKPNLSDHYA
jgi:hypothetical protein